MDPNQAPTNRQTEHLGINKIGKNIKKSPLQQANFPNAARQQAQPQVYNINKNDFRDIVQQLTGSPLRDPPPRPRPPQNHPKPPNNRLQRVRPPPLAHTVRPIPYPHNHGRPPPPPHFDHHPSPNFLPPPTPPDVWANTTESPISAYMRYLQNSIIDSGPRQPQPFPQPHMQPAMPPLPSPRLNGPPSNLPSPRFNGPPPPLLASPRMNGPPPLLPSPTSQFLLPSPTAFFNLFSPRSPYPLLSPGFEHPPPLSPNFSFSSMGQSGILGPGPHPPPSPGMGFPCPLQGFSLRPVQDGGINSM